MAVRRRGQLEPPGVEEQPVEAGANVPAADVGAPPRGTGPVDRISRYRVADGLEVDPDLVRSPRDQVELEERPAREPLLDPVSGRRRAPVGDDGHPGAVLRISADRRLDPPDRGGNLAEYEGEVRLFHPPGLELGHQRRLGR